jgi:UDP-N-acetylglucosamine--N-acetylmuramyl-(pentapeptide) pyrophosphoryl-undecaprenol N-acetylglucosamine transferase
VVGLPAVLVPYPHATGDHQAHNAALLVEAGGAELVADGDATAERVGPLLEERLADPSALARMAAASRAAARPRAAEELAAWALELAGSER